MENVNGFRDGWGVKLIPATLGTADFHQSVAFMFTSREAAAAFAAAATEALSISTVSLAYHRLGVYDPNVD